MPVQLGLSPKDVTATTSSESVVSNVGPPESPKHAPVLGVVRELEVGLLRVAHQVEQPDIGLHPRVAPISKIRCAHWRP
jgi:hypothetical protein